MVPGFAQLELCIILILKKFLKLKLCSLRYRSAIGILLANYGWENLKKQLLNGREYALSNYWKTN